MPRCACCGHDFERSRPHSPGSCRSASVTGLQAALDPSGADGLYSQLSELKSTVSAPALHISRTGSRTPRSCRKANLLSQTGLVSVPLRSQAADPFVADVAREKILTMSRSNPRKLGARTFSLNKDVDMASPKFARALSLLRTNRPSRIQEHVDAKPEELSATVRRGAQYCTLPPRERSLKNRGHAKDWKGLSLVEKTVRSAIRPSSAGFSCTNRSTLGTSRVTARPHSASFLSNRSAGADSQVTAPPYLGSFVSAAESQVTARPYSDSFGRNRNDARVYFPTSGQPFLAGSFHASGRPASASSLSGCGSFGRANSEFNLLAANLVEG